MGKLSTVIFLMISITTYSQTEYYTTDGKNRLTKLEVKNQLSKKEDEMSKVIGQKLYGNLTIENTETKADSIIHKVKLTLKSKGKTGLSGFGPLSQFKNKPIPNFNLKTLNGENFNSDQLKGKPTIINFWFTNCVPCIQEIPALNVIYDKFKNDFNFISITYEKQKNVDKFLQKIDFKFTHLIEAEQYIDDSGVQTYPLNLFLDKNGIVKDIKYGIPKVQNQDGKIIDGDGKQFIELLQNLK